MSGRGLAFEDEEVVLARELEYLQPPLECGCHARRVAAVLRIFSVIAPLYTLGMTYRYSVQNLGLGLPRRPALKHLTQALRVRSVLIGADLCESVRWWPGWGRRCVRADLSSHILCRGRPEIRL